MSQDSMSRDEGKSPARLAYAALIAKVEESKEWDRRIEEAKAAKKQSKSDIDTMLEGLFRLTRLSKANKIASKMYWSNDDLFRRIKPVFKSVFGTTPEIKPKIKEFTCEGCGTAFTFVFKTREARKMFLDKGNEHWGYGGKGRKLCRSCLRKAKAKTKVEQPTYGDRDRPLLDLHGGHPRHTTRSTRKYEPDDQLNELDEEYEIRTRGFTSYPYTVEELRSMPYEKYLKTKHWVQLRQAVWQRDDHTCCHCQAKGVKLNTHHLTYERRGCELLEDLLTLCEPCHEKVHGIGEGEK